MKLSKRILPVVLVFAMLLSCIQLPAMATVTTSGTYWQEDFTGQTKNTNLSTFSNNQVENVQKYANADDSALEQKVHDSLIVDGAKGVYGKAPFDTSFLHQTQWDGDTLPSVPNVNYGQMRNGLTFTNITRNVAESDKKILHFSFDYATNDYYIPTTLWTTSWYRNDKGAEASGYGDANTEIFAVSNTGKVTSSKAQIVEKLAPNQWYHFDFVFDMGTVTAKNQTPYEVYVNGELKGTFEYDAQRGGVNEANGVTTGEKPAYGMRSLMFQGGMQSKVNNVYPLAQTYYDNLAYETLTAKPAIAPVSLTSSNSAVVVDNAAKTVTLDNASTAAADVSAAVSGNMVKSVAVKDAEGTDVAENVSDGDYLCVTTTGNTTEYYTISAPPAPPEGGEIAGTLQISGTAKLGHTLTADISSITPAGVILTYSWARGDSVVGTEKTYTVAEEDIGSALTLTVTAAGALYRDAFGNVGRCSRHHRSRGDCKLLLPI